MKISSTSSLQRITYSNSKEERGADEENPLIQSKLGFAVLEHKEKKADIWTNLGAIGEGISSGASNFYWGVSLANLIWSFSGSEDTPPALSWTLSSCLTLFAIGAVYAHRKLNIYHQHDAHSHDAHSHDAHSHDVHSHDVHSHDVHSHDVHFHEGDLCNYEKTHKQLTGAQKAALIADFISHTGDICGPISAGVDAFANYVLKTTIPPWGQAVAQIGATIIGGITAVANVRSCKHAIESQNT